MLKNTLLDLMSRMPCRVGEVVQTMDDDTREAFGQVMSSEVGDKTISDALKTEGVLISREAIRGHRHCFREETRDQCKCFPIKETK